MQFKLEDTLFFRQYAKGHLRQLSRNSIYEEILSADAATLTLDNQKNGWKEVCVYQEQNVDKILSPVRSLGRRFVSIRNKVNNKKTYLSAYWFGGRRKDLNA